MESGITNQWLKNYITPKTQLVELDCIISSSVKIECGVPQGSNLGPSLYLIHVNNRPIIYSYKTLSLFKLEMSLNV